MRELCDEMHGELRDRSMPALLDEGFRELPEPALTPADTFRRLVRGETEKVAVSKLTERRVAAEMVVPYPPGIPILMPGERVGAQDGPFVRYLLALEDFDRRFPSFEHDIHGIERDAEGNYLLECVKEEAL